MKKKPAAEKPAEKLPEPVTISLSVKDRLMVAALFPEKSNIVGQVIARDLAAKFEISDKEAKEISLVRSPDGRYKWDPVKVKDKTFELTGPEIAYLKEQVMRVDAAKQVTFDMLPLCEKVQKADVHP